jgi:hypothetical protein
MQSAIVGCLVLRFGTLGIDVAATDFLPIGVFAIGFMPAFQVLVYAMQKSGSCFMRCECTT